MKIVIVGPDGSGKTTLANELSKQLNIPLGPKGTYQIEPIDMLLKVLTFVKNVDDEEKVIYDRFNYPDDIIYRRTLGEPLSPLTPLSLLIESKLADSKRALFLHVTADPVALTERNDGDEYLPINKLCAIKEAYHEWFASTFVPTITIDTSKTVEEETIKFVVKAIKHYFEKNGVV